MPCNEFIKNNTRWRPVEATNGKYIVSENGEVISFAKNSQKVLKPRINRRYKSVTLYGFGGKERKIIFIHRLVLEAFIGECPEGYEAAHLNGKRFDNHISNLKWVSHLENMQHKKIHGTQPYGETSYRAKITEQDLLKMKQLRLEGKYYREIGEIYGMTPTSAMLAITGKNWKHQKGVKIKFVKCRKGHPLNEQNSYFDKRTGWKRCKICKQKTNKAYQERRQLNGPM